LALPVLNLPPAPEPQPGDNEEVSVTVGQMRQALFYYELVPLYEEHVMNLRKVAENYADELARKEIENRILEDVNKDLKAENRSLKFQRIGLAAVVTAATIYLIVR